MRISIVASIATPVVMMALLSGCAANSGTSSALERLRTSTKACSVTQVQAVMFGDVAADTISQTGDFAQPDLFSASQSVICAGEYATTDPDAYDTSRVSIAILAGGSEVFEKLDKTLQAADFPESSLSGMSTHGWSNSDVQIYAVKMSDSLADSRQTEFTSKTKAIVVTIKPVQD
ncbi:hypothetical protein [Cryobacterium aureum]|uniref:hypothetical protein n=1 Tax=Cryobacterium aureum TaxID=995037 RepID=UPI000CF51257|nr:hypothetical protein [Cryobacterium aureum]